MIKVQSLVRKFGDFEAVKDISFEVKPGELFAFLGPNGAGKTTTIKMLTTVLAPTSGSILIDGLDPTKHQVNWSLLPIALVAMTLIAVVFCAFGTAIGSRLENMQAFPLVMNFLMMPLFFLSGALFPLEGLPRVLQVITQINPLSYGVDGLRATLIDMTHFGLATDLGVLAAVGAVFIGLGAYSFSKIQL